MKLFDVNEERKFIYGQPKSAIHRRRVAFKTIKEQEEEKNIINSIKKSERRSRVIKNYRSKQNRFSSIKKALRF